MTSTNTSSKKAWQCAAPSSATPTSTPPWKTGPQTSPGALYGVYGTLGLGLLLFCMRAMQPERKWNTKLIGFAFWAINIGMLMALNRAPELAVHIRGARNNGLSELEIREAIIHATTYCGVPAGVDAMKTAERVLNDMAAKGEMERELGGRSERAGPEKK